MKFRPDPYIVGIIAAVALAIVLPVHGAGAATFSTVSKLAVGLLFFLYGARLAPDVVIAGLIRWRLHLLVLSITFVLFPLIGLGLPLLPSAILAPGLVAGMTYLTCLPSTMQSSVALVGAARGDVAAALCSASASNTLGVVVTPVLAALLLHAQGISISGQAIRDILIQLLAPFIVGQLVHRWLGPPLARFKQPLSWYDRFTILLIVYGAFSTAMVQGVWRQVAPLQFVALVLLCAALLAIILVVCRQAARLLGFRVEGEIVIVICGSQKGLAAGVAMASLIFKSAELGLVLLPVMVYHQLQLMTCAVLAGRYGRRNAAETLP